MTDARIQRMTEELVSLRRENERLSRRVLALELVEKQLRDVVKQRDAQIAAALRPGLGGRGYGCSCSSCLAREGMEYYRQRAQEARESADKETGVAPPSPRSQGQPGGSPSDVAAAHEELFRPLVERMYQILVSEGLVIERSDSGGIPKAFSQEGHT